MSTMPGQSPLIGEEAKKYEILMQKSVRILREEAKRAKLCAGAKTKSELAYSMVKEKRPRRKISDTSEDPLPSSGPKCEGLDRLDRDSRTLYPSLRIASHPQQRPFPPNFSPAQLLAGADAGLLEDELTRPGSPYQTEKDRLKENDEKVVAYVPRVKQLFSDSGEQHRDRMVMADHRRQDYISVPKHSHPYPGCILHRTPLDSIAPPRGPKRSHDDEAEPTQRLSQPPLSDKRLIYGSSEPAPPPNAGRGRHESVIKGQGGWSCSTQRLEQSSSPCQFYDTTLPSPVIYRPSPAFSTQEHLSYDRSATLTPIRYSSGGRSSYPAPSYEKHVFEPVNSPHPPPTELSEEDRTLPPIREALSFLSWSDHS